MTNFKLIVPILLNSVFCIAQESFRTTYYLSQGRSSSIKIMKDIKVKYSDLNDVERKKLVHDKFPPIGTVIRFTTDKIVNGASSKLVKFDTVSESFYKKQKNISKTVEEKTFFSKRRKVSVKLDDKGKLFINPIDDLNIYRKKEERNKRLKRDEFYIKLKDREYIWIPFTEFTVTSLTIPLKYRFANDDIGLREDFTSAINLNFFLGVTYGNSKFIHRKNVGNKTNTWKLTGGLIFGTSTVSLNANNTTLALVPLAANEAQTKGLFSWGFGATYAFRNINLGLFYGWDYSIGENSDKWNYNREPWLGIGVGYSLFKI